MFDLKFQGSRLRSQYRYIFLVFPHIDLVIVDTEHKFAWYILPEIYIKCFNSCFDFEFRSQRSRSLFEKPIYDFLSNFYWHFLSNSYHFWDIWLQTFQGMTLIFDPWMSPEVKKCITIRKRIYDFLFDFHGHHLSISYRSRKNAGQNYEGRTKWLNLSF